MATTFTISKTVLSAALLRANDVCPKRSPKPVLCNARIVVTGQNTTRGVYIESTDLEHGLIDNLSSVASRHRGAECEVLVNTAALKKQLGGNRDKEIVVSIHEQHIEIAGGRIPLAPEAADELPTIPFRQSTTSIELPADELVRLINRTIHSVDKESSRYALGALLIEIDSARDYLRLVGTDGRRLATDYVGTDDGAAEFTALWHATHAKHALKALKKATTARLGIGKDHVTLICIGKNGEQQSYEFRQVGGRFPEWRDVFPSDLAEVCVVEATKVADIAKGCSAALSKDDSRACDICCNDDVLTMGNANGSYFAMIECASRVQSLDIAIDPRFVFDWMTSLKDYVVTIHAFNRSLETRDNCEQSDRPLMFECQNARYIVMPMARS